MGSCGHSLMHLWNICYELIIIVIQVEEINGNIMHSIVA